MTFQFSLLSAVCINSMDCDVISYNGYDVPGNYQ